MDCDFTHLKTCMPGSDRDYPVIIRSDQIRAIIGSEIPKNQKSCCPIRQKLFIL